MSLNYSERIASAISTFLTEDDWKFDFQEEKGVFRFGVNLKNKIRNVQYVVDVHETDYTVYGLIPLSAERDDMSMMMRMAEFITRANYGLRDGNFELDFRDGEIRFKCYVNCDEMDRIPRTIIERSIYCPAAMYERYGDGILKILFFDTSAKEAVALCENRPHYEDTDDSSDMTDAMEDSLSVMDCDEEDVESDESDASSDALMRMLREHLANRRTNHEQEE